MDPRDRSCLARIVAAIFATGVFMTGALGADKERLVPESAIRPLEDVLQTVAAWDLQEERAELASIMEGLGWTPRKMNETGSRKKPSLQEAVRTLRSTALRLARYLDDEDEDRRERIARLILRLDQTVGEAHIALGREEKDGQWIGPDEANRIERRGRIQEALQKARRLPFTSEVEKSDNPLLKQVYGNPGIKVTVGRLELHSAMSAEKTARILGETYRILAYSAFLTRGKLSPPLLQSTWVLLDSQEAYLRALDESFMGGNVEEAEARRARELMSYLDLRGFGVLFDRFEASVVADLLFYLEPDTPTAQPCLRAGHLNGVCLSYLGIAMPQVIEYISDLPGAGDMRYAAWPTPGLESEKRADSFRLKRAGIAGCREWMAELAAREEDPPWRLSMKSDLGLIQDRDLIKTTLVTLFLEEQGPLMPLLQQTAPGLPENRSLAAPDLFEQALGEPLDRFEARWREWVAPRRKGLAARLEDAALERDPGKPDPVLEIVNQWRMLALGQSLLKPEMRNRPLKARESILKTPEYRIHYEVFLDENLSSNAQRHAAYLLAHPDQIAAWPASHEEYPDREGFSPEGAWSGAHSLVGAQMHTFHQALNTWMGSFYHRLPLLDPGLFRIGYAFDQGMAILDAGSLVVPVESERTAVWPYDGMDDVPTGFFAEQPHPAPGEDPERLGYPVTLQVWRPVLSLPVKMTLYEGSTLGKEVDCLYTTPDKPLNAELVPPNAFCLIPTSPLKANKTYTVLARIGKEEETLTWSFRTGGS